MLSNIIFSLDRVAPYFLLIALGIFLNRSGRTPYDFFKNANRFVFKIALPIQLFYNIATADNSSGKEIKFMIYTLVVTILTFMAAWTVTEILYRDNKAIIGTLVQGAFRGNFVLLGVPLANAVLGPPAAKTAALTTIVLIPAYNALSVVVLSLRGTSGEKTSPATVLRGIISNPLIISASCAIPLWLLGIKLPQMVQTTCNYVGMTATPLGLLSVGGMLNLKDAAARLRPAIYATAMKNVILPLAVMLISYRLGYRNEELLVMLVLSATPVAIGSYAMASEMGGDGPLASNILILSTFFSGFTLALGIYILKTFALI